MNEMSRIDANAHDAPLVELVARLGAGRSLRERVVALRYKRRRRPAGTVVPVASAAETAFEAMVENDNNERLV
jgi:hypothetical protein